MFVNRLALIIIFGVEHTVISRDRLSGFVGFEAEITRFMLLGEGRLAKAGIAEHQVVMRLQIFRVDGEHLFKFFYGINIMPLEK